MKEYAKFAADKAIELLNIDSPSGYTRDAIEWVSNEFRSLGFDVQITKKGAALICLGGSGDNGVLFETHTDTLGGIVAEVKSNGRLRISNIGGLCANNVETENVRVRTRSGKVYEGTLQLVNASLHVNQEIDKTERNFDNLEVVLDEDVKTSEDTRKLGIDVGDLVCPFPRAHITDSGYIKSRFLDDKLSVCCLLGLAKYIHDSKIALSRKVYGFVTVFEEVGHGGSSSIPDDVTDAISIDMGCVGTGLQCTERQVSICVKDSGGPYNYDLTTELIEAAKKEKADYAVDVYPNYGSDVEATLRSGYDVRHGLIGPGVYASHGYERSHLDGVLATLKVLKGFLNI